MSYVDLMGDAVPSEADIVNWSEALVREHVSEARERILTRRFLGALLPEGHPLHRPMAPEQQAELGRAVGAFVAAEVAADQARADAALLQRVLAHERGEVLLEEGDAAGHALLEQRAAARPAPEPAESEPVTGDVD